MKKRKAVVAAIKSNSDYAVSMAVCLNFFFLGGENIFSQILSRWVFNKNLMNYASGAVIVIFYLFVFFHHKIYQRLKASSVFFLLIGIGSWLFSFLIHPELLGISETITSITSFFFYNFLPLIFLPTVKDKKIYFNVQIAGARVFSVFVICICLFSLLTDSFVSSYSMTFGAHLLLPCCTMCAIAIRDMRLKDILIAMAEIVFIVMYASRYPLICIASCIIAFGIKYRFNKSRFRGMWVLLFLIVVLVLFFFIMFDGPSMIISFMEGQDIESRTLLLLLEGRITNDSGRSEIHNQLFEEILKKPLLGYGSFGGIYSSNIHQPHGLVYDMLASFGILGTVVLMVCLVLRTAKLVKSGKLALDLVLIFACTVVPISLIQMGFWSATRLWLFVALIL